MTDFALTPVTVLEMDLDHCQNTYGADPCTAGRVESGTAQAGTSTTLTLAAGASAVDDVHVNRVARLKTGAGSVQERRATDYNGTSKVLTVSQRWRTNLIHRSEQFDLWTLAGASVSPNTDYGVDGALSADTITDASAVAFGNVNLTSAIALPSYDQTVVAKFWVKKDAIGRATRFVDVRVNFFGGTTRLIRLKLDTSTGEYTAPVTASTVQEFIGVQLFPTANGDFWVVTIIGHSTDVANNSTGLQIYPAAGFGAAFTDDITATGSAVLSRAQLEYASSEGDYIATAASAITLPDATTVYDIIDRPNACYNSFKTCQDKMHYVRGTKTHSFVTTGAPIPAGEVMRPYIKAAKFAPTEIDPQEGVARRADVGITMVDEPAPDTDLDPYVEYRAAAAQGTYWARLVARTHNYSGRWARIRRAYLTGAWDWNDFTTELYIVESIKGPSKGEVTINLKDPVKLADRQKVPLATSGKLAAVFGTNDLQLVMNAGDGTQYDASGYVRVGEQVVRFAHKHVAQGWNFSDSSLDGWAVTNGTLTGGLDAATFTATVADAYISQSGLGFSGGSNRYVRVRFRQLVAGAWEGTLYYSTGAHGFSTSYRKTVSAPAGLAAGGWVYLTLDMHDLTAGGNDWSQNTITGLRLDLVSGAAGSFEIDWIGYAANAVFEADVLVWPNSTYRSQFGTTAVAAKVGDGVQQCQAYIAQSVSAVIQSLLNLSGIGNANIDIAGLQAEDTAWLAGRFTITACLTEPEDITALLGEICQQTGSMLWWSPSAQKVKFKVLAPSSPTASAGKVLNEEAHLMLDSVKVEPLDAQRITMFGVYYDITSATANRKEAKNFLKGELYIDADAESENEYGDRRQKILYSRWFGTANDVAMRTLAARKVSQYRDAPRKIDFKVDAKDAAITEGDLYDITTDEITDATGAAAPVRALIVKRQDNAGDISVTALTTTFGRRYGFIAPAGYPNYGAASEAQRQYAYIADANGLMSDGSEGYLVI